ncbi:GT2 family glycosyltransferase [Aequitasia blattaphilus]|uniref:Glycosyltransferase family 2 protein n=1 Tax=Aequitasia blattaphilus TaxID=2949332 RepID=A0ABT1E689_9FIRM|nr:glycosyltransferase family 2 protein [Aequitasia blattaphilus]MCP1101359.1 glycosyltransferase family 2 protein [Aequitasia blattaphilus]MCR8613999.1 glycosyltransferase family 2 protein [Aequitasia blattaphilus]
MKEVTIVIPNYNGIKFLNHCLSSIQEKNTLDVDVIIVDNASEDGSIQEARREYPHYEYILLDKNYGFSRAVNEGIKRAKTPYVLLLNNDTEIEYGFVEELLSSIKKNDKVFSVEALMIQYNNRNKVDSAGTFYNAMGWAYARGRDKDVENYRTEINTFAACAGAAIYRREVFKKIGLFDESFFAYLEDIDVGYRGRIAGYKNKVEPKARVYHIGSGSSGSRYNLFKIGYSSRNNIYLIYKNMPTLQIILNLPFLLIGFGIKYVFFVKKGFGKEYFKGLISGFKYSYKVRKTKVRKENIKNYILIQMELWVNIFRKFLSK